MARDNHHVPVSLHVPGVHEKVRARQLSQALRPDPRLGLVGNVERPLALTPPESWSPTSLGQTEKLLRREAIRLPRWFLGGRTIPEARGWAPYDDRRVTWFTLTPDDGLTPAG